mmetsp:Transcript_87840/g.237986  ORF Transcript_87840/g.237986 Transcript_87840/m.237986 type:complete len:319 (+) Transcript_87840:97-1053(+)
MAVRTGARAPACAGAGAGGHASRRAETGLASRVCAGSRGRHRGASLALRLTLLSVVLAALGCLAPSAAFAARAARLGAPLAALLAAASGPGAALGALLPAGTNAPTNSGFLNESPEVQEYKGQANGGVMPGDLGLEPRKMNRKGEMSKEPELRTCRDTEKSCFSTNPERMRPGNKNTWYLKPWQAPTDKPVKECMTELLKVIKEYPVGQGGIDKGGFRVVKLQKNYVYVQFRGIDLRIADVEFAVRDDGTVLIRSGARSVIDVFDGFAAYGDRESNAIRLNYIAAKLRENGWSAPDITVETHPEYFKAAMQNLGSVVE